MSDDRQPTTLEAVVAAVRGAVVDRRGLYGEPADFCRRVAARWSLTLGVPVQPWQVPLLMADFKHERFCQNPDHADSAVDGAGYFVMLPSVVADCRRRENGEG